MKILLDIFWAFFVIGAVTFGGGYAIVPVLERELVKKRGWADMDEVMDYYSIAQFTPGVIAVNIAVFIGFKRRGVLGAIFAAAAVVLPGTALVLIIMLFIHQFADYPAVQHAFAGIRTAVCALILDTILKLCKGLLKNIRSIVIFIAALGVSAALGLSPMLIVLTAGLIGLLFYFTERRTKGETL